MQALYAAFADGQREPNNADVFAVAEQFVPLSRTMADDIEKRRKRLEGVAKLAGGTVQVAPVAGTKGRKLVKFGG